MLFNLSISVALLLTQTTAVVDGFILASSNGRWRSSFSSQLNASKDIPITFTSKRIPRVAVSPNGSGTKARPVSNDAIDSYDSSRKVEVVKVDPATIMEGVEFTIGQDIADLIEENAVMSARPVPHVAVSSHEGGEKSLRPKAVSDGKPSNPLAHVDRKIEAYLETMIANGGVDLEPDSKQLQRRNRIGIP